MMVLEQKKSLEEVRAKAACFFVALGDAAFDRLFPLSLALRQRGVAVDMSYERDKKMKWLLKQADRSGAPLALLLGDDELARGEATLKNMKDSTQEILSLTDLESTLYRRLKG
jgi:histidyl-tRNA synthetase